MGAISQVEGASTAAGPINDAAIAASGSDVLRHEQEWGPEVAFIFDRE